MLKAICDRCGKDISDSGRIGYMSLIFRESIGGSVVQENLMKGKHFCSSCMEDIQEFAASLKQTPGPRTSRKRKTDYSKIMTLHNAGWSNSKIACEMGMTKSSVSGAIWYYKNKIQREEEGDGVSGGQSNTDPIL